MKILINDDIPEDLWKSFLSENQFASPFQSRDFYCLINATAGLSAVAIAVLDGVQILALAVLTLQEERGVAGFFSRRAIIYGGPLADTRFPEAVNLLLTQIPALVKGKAIYAEIRNLNDYGCFRDIYTGHGWDYVPYVNFLVATGDVDQMTRNVSSSRLRQIRKAISSGVSWKEARSLKEVRGFFEILEELYRTKIKKPMLPWEFFREAFERKFGVFLMVVFKGNIIGGIMCPVLERRAIYEFYVCGLDSEYKEQYPSVMATWACMEYAGRNAIPLFDFMGAGISGEGYGVRDFKERFGGKLVGYGRFRKIINPILFRAGVLGLKIRAGLKK